MAVASLLPLVSAIVFSFRIAYPATLQFLPWELTTAVSSSAIPSLFAKRLTEEIPLIFFTS